MGRLSTLRAFFVFACFAAGPPALAEPPPSSLNLAAAVDAAWQRSPEARELTGRAREWAARRDLADGWVAGPGAVSVSHAADRRQPGEGKAEWEVELAWPLWLPGQRSAQLTLAERGAAALEARRQALRAELAGELGRRLAAWRVARGEAALAHDRAAAAVALEADLERRLGVGEAARFEANLARAERLAAESAAGEADLAAAQARDQWVLLTGEAAETPPDLVLPALAEPAGAEPPALRAARQAEAAAAARAQAERSATRAAPELALRMVRQRDGVDEPWGDEVGLKFTLPLGGGAGWRAATAAAEADQARAAADLETEQRRAEMTRLQARAELSRAEAALAAALRRQQLTEDNHKLADQAYRLGQFDLSTLLRTRATAFEAVLEVGRAEARQDLARLQHLLASGVTP